MRYKVFGRSGLRVSELAPGTMTFGPDWGWGADKDVSRAMFDAYAEAGGNMVDTANRYTDGTAEQYDNRGCLDVDLTAEQRERLDGASAFDLDFPHDFIGGGRQSFMGAISDQVDDHRRTVV
jgi:hypothetical protein